MAKKTKGTLKGRLAEKKKDLDRELDGAIKEQRRLIEQRDTFVNAINGNASKILQIQGKLEQLNELIKEENE